ncbi:MAG: SprB repeat-containing protein [Crocinitomicaceae bacterium]|nr:SprB repeat-containing protein [Crocinitomicaceae bacterium]
MKTLQSFTAVLALTISTLTFGNGSDTSNKNEMRISVIEIIKPTCNGLSNGSVTVEAEGGKAPYTYLWNTFPEQTTAMAVNLKSGIYFVQVTDANGAVHFESVKVDDRISTTASSSVTKPVSEQTINIRTEKNPENYTYVLDGEVLKEPVITGLDVGIHKLVISDNNNCTVMQFIQVVEIESTESSEVVQASIETSAIESLEILENEIYNVNLSMLNE